MKKTKFTALLVSMCMLMTQMAGIVSVFASSMSFNNGTVSIDWEGESTNATLITAEYDVNGVLSQLKTYDENLNTGTNNIDTDYLNAGTKVMLWDSTSNMKPLMSAYWVSGGEITSLSVDDTYQLSESNGVSTMSVKSLDVSYSTSETWDTGVITIAAPSEDYQKTLMVLKPGTDKANILVKDIIAIDQGEDISQVRIPALDETTDAGVYTVLMGGTSGDIYMGTFSIGAASILCGDLDKDCEISIYDAQQIAKYDVGSVDLSEEDLLAADCDFDGKVNSRDALEILKYYQGYVGEYVGTCITGGEEHNVDTETKTADMSVKLVQNMNSSVGRHIVFDIAYSCDSSYLQSLSAYIPINKEYVESVDIKYYSDFSSGLSYGGYDAAKEQISLSFANMNGICGTYNDGKYKIAAVILNLTDAWDGGEINLSDFIVTTNDDHKMSMKNAVTAEGLTPVIQDEISGSYTDMGYDGIENEIKWKCASDGVLTIGGTGIIKQSPWSDLYVKSIVIEEGITQFYANVFSGFENLECITIPTSLVRVRSLNTLSGKVNFKVDEFNNNFSSFDGALYDKKKIKLWLYAKDEINPDYALPDGIIIVDSSAFAGGSHLRSVILPNTLDEIRTGAFNNCSSLETIYIGKNITSIKSDAFNGCSALSTVYYNGTEDEWNSIVIESGNDNLIKANIVCNKSVAYYNLNNHDETLANQMFTSGDEVTITSEIPVRDGYTFLGWSTNPYDLQAMYHAGEKITPSGNLVLYAVWSPDKYEIEFVTNDGGDNITVEQGYETKIKYPLISRNGYKFNGWYKDAELTQQADITVMPAGKLTFYAKWTAIAKNDMKILWKCGFEETENCNSEENGNNYAVMPSLVNGDNGQQSYNDINGISLNTSKRYGDDSSYFKLDSENVGDIENSYLTTAICRFSNLERGNTIRFNGDTGYSPSEDNNLVFVFDVKMKDSDDLEIIYDTNFSIGKTIVSRDKLGTENDEWAKVMVIYSLDEGMRLYKINGGTAELIAEDANNTTLLEMAFNAHVSSDAISSEHPYGYPLVSLDNMYIYTVGEENFSLETLNELHGFGGRLKKAVNLQWNGTTAQWDSVPHATGYDVSLLRNGTVIKTVNGVEGTSYDFSADLKNGCVYRFKVAAISADNDYNNGRDAVGGIYSSSGISVGDYVQMGRYYDEPILWRCIDVDENGPLLVTDKILCVKSYDAPGNNTIGSHTEYSEYSAYWGDSNLRCWLNSDAEAEKVVWTCGNPPSSKALSYDAYDGEAGFLSNFSTTEKYVINPSSRNNGAFIDKVTLPNTNEINIINYNNDILGSDYKMGILSDKAAENSEYLKNNSYFDEETQTELKYKSGDKYDTYYLTDNARSVNYIMSNGNTASTDGGVYCGVRPAIHIKDGFEMSGDGSAETPYIFIDEVAAKVSLPENDVTPKIYDIIKIPVSVSENTGFASAAVSLSYDTDKYTFISVTPSSSLLGATITKSETNDGVNILAVNPSNITGDGTIFTVNLMVNVDALNTTSDISVRPVEFYDENQKLLVIDTGNANMRSILSVSGDVDENTKVNSADAVLLSQYLAKYQSSSLSDTQKNNADVYTDSKINIKDMYVLSQYIVNNLTSTNSAMSLFAADNPKLSASASYADNDNSMIDVTFSVKDNSGFTSFLFEMGFDKTRLTPVSITSDDVLKNESITSNVNETGVDLSSLNEVTALLNKSEGAVESDGKLYTVRFKINGELADDDVITFKNSGFISKVNDIQLDAPTSINLKEALNTVDEPQNEVSNLKADAGDGQVTLSWDKNDNALAYVIYQDGEQKPPVFDTSCIVTGLNNGTQYTFTVKILSSSGLSEGVSVTAVPLLAIPPSDDNVHITYNNGTANILSDYGLNNVVVIFAEYDSDDVLVSVESKPVTVAAGTSTNYSKDKTVGEGNKVKVMLWNSMKEMQPLHSVVE